MKEVVSRDLESATVCVIGGGPAGLFAALALRREGFAVTVVEASEYDGYRAGEHLIAECLPYMASLEIPDRILDSNSIRCHVIESIWGHASLHSYDSIFNPYGAGLLLSRPAFDRDLAWLAQERGVDLRIGAKARRAELKAGRWLVDYRTRNTICTVAADFIIDASGRNGLLGSAVAARRIRFDNLIGITTLIGSCWDNRIQKGSLFVEAVSDGWWYLTILQEDSLVATFFTDGDLLDKTMSLRENLRVFSEQSERASCAISNGTIVRQPRAYSAISQIGSALYGQRYVAIGDAAWSVDPLASKGLYKALKTGSQTPKLVQECLANCAYALPTYEREQKKEFYEYLRQRAEYYRMESRWSDSEFWSRRHTAPASLP